MIQIGIRIILIYLLTILSVAAQEVRDYYEESGANPFQTKTSDAPNESIDPFSGMLQITHNELVIPGNGGMDLVLTRAYTSVGRKNKPTNIWNRFGTGWVMHMGRVVGPDSTAVCDQPNVLENTLDNPSIELKSGARELLVDSSLTGVSGLITRSNLRTSCFIDLNDDVASYSVYTPDGTRYKFIYLSAYLGGGWAVRSITDVHGNWIRIDYETSGFGFTQMTKIYRSEEYNSLDPAEGGEDNPLVVFEYYDLGRSVARLKSMTYGDKVWEYFYEKYSVTDSFPSYSTYALTQVKRPDGKSWIYEYYTKNDAVPGILGRGPGSYSLKKMIYPDGAEVDYTYQYVNFYPDDPLDFVNSVRTKTITNGTGVGGVANKGVWTYDFAPSSDGGSLGSSFHDFVPASTGGLFKLPEPLKIDVTTITSPYGKFIYRHLGKHTVNYEDVIPRLAFWLSSDIGRLQLKETYDLFHNLIEKRLYNWDRRKISNEFFLQGDRIRGFDFIGTSHGVTYVPILIDEAVVTSDFRGYATTSYENYDQFGNPGRVIEQSGSSVIPDKITEFEYLNDTAKWIIGLPIKETIFNGGSVIGEITREYDPITRDLISETRFGVTTRYSYHPTGDLHRITNAEDQVTMLRNYRRGSPQHEINGIEPVRDSSDNVIGETDGVTTTLRTVNAAGTIASETDPRGNTTRFRYDLYNRLTKIDFPMHADVDIGYVNAIKPHQAKRVLTRGDYQQKDYFDGFGRISRTEREGVGVSPIAVETRYDLIGRMVFKSYANSTNGTRFIYDALDRQIKQINADGTEKATLYNQNIAVETNERGHSKRTRYRNFGADMSKRIPYQIFEPEDVTTIIFSNALGKTTQIFQGEQQAGGGIAGHPRTYGYDGRAYLTSEVNPETGTTIYGRDQLGKMTSKQVGTSDITTYSYDALNRLELIDYPPGTPDRSYQYDGNNNITSIISTDATLNYRYDLNDNLIREDQLINGIDYTIQYAYSNLDHVSRLTYFDDHTVNFAPDELGRPTKVAPYITNITYHANSTPSILNYANGRTSRFTLTNREWIKKTITDGGIYNREVTNYDGVGNLLTIQDFSKSNNHRTLVYDQLNRLTNAEGPWGNGLITYNATGDIQSKHVGANTLDYFYNGTLLNSISGFPDFGGDAHYLYDTYGNITQKKSSAAGWRYHYDDASNLREIRDFNDQVIRSYAYAGNDINVSAVMPDETRHFIYTKGGQLLSDVKIAGTRPTVHNIYFKNILIAERELNVVDPDVLVKAENNPTIYGYGFGDSNHKDQVMSYFDLPLIDGDVQFCVNGYGINTADEVSVSVNGHVIGALEVSQANAPKKSCFVIPQALLLTGRNHVTFVQTLPGHTWGVQFSYRVGEDLPGSTSIMPMIILLLLDEEA